MRLRLGWWVWLAIALGLLAALFFPLAASATTNWTENFDAYTGAYLDENCNQTVFTIGNFTLGYGQPADVTTRCGCDKGAGGTFTVSTEQAYSGTHSWRRTGKSTSGGTPWIAPSSLPSWSEIYMGGAFYIESGYDETDQKLLDSGPRNLTALGNNWLELKTNSSAAGSPDVTLFFNLMVSGASFYLTDSSVYICKAWGADVEGTSPSATSYASGSCAAGGSSTTLKGASQGSPPVPPFANYTPVAGDLAYDDTSGAFAPILAKVDSSTLTTKPLFGLGASTWATGDHYDVVPKNSGRWLNLGKDRWHQIIHRVKQVQGTITETAATSTLDSNVIGGISDTSNWHVGDRIYLGGLSRSGWRDKTITEIIDGTSFRISSTAPATATGIEVIPCNDTVETYVDGRKVFYRVGAGGGGASDASKGTLKHGLTDYLYGYNGFEAIHWFLSSWDAQCTVYYWDDLYLGQDKPAGILDDPWASNQAPVLASIGTQNGTQDSPFTVSGSATDFEDAASALRFTIANKPAWATLTDHLDGTWTLAGTPTSSGLISGVQITVTDTAANTDSETPNIYIAPVNHAPVLTPIGDKGGTTGTTLTFTVAAADEDEGQSVAYTVSNAPGDSSIDSGTGVFTWTTPTAGTATDIIFTATDDGTPNRIASETISIVISTPPEMFCCSWEEGAGAGDAILNDGGDADPCGDVGDIWTNNIGAGNLLSRTTTTTYSGSAGALAYTSGSVSDYLQRSITATGTLGERVAFRVATDGLADTETTTFLAFKSNAVIRASIRLVQTEGSLYLQAYAHNGTTLAAFGDAIPVSLNAWVIPRLRFGKASGSCSMDVYDDTGAQIGATQTTTTTADIDINNIALGYVTGTGGSCTFYLDALRSLPSNDFPDLPNRATVLASVGNQTVEAGQTLSVTLTATDEDGDSLTFTCPEAEALGATLTSTSPQTATLRWIPSYALDIVGDHTAITITVSDGTTSDTEDITITVTASARARQRRRPLHLFPGVHGELPQARWHG